MVQPASEKQETKNKADHPQAMNPKQTTINAPDSPPAISIRDWQNQALKNPDDFE